MGGGDNPNICANRHAAANRCELTFLKHPQQSGLRVDRHVSNLVEKQRAALRLLKSPHAACGRPGERPFLMAEQLALDQLTRYRCHVDGNKRPVPALTEIV